MTKRRTIWLAALSGGLLFCLYYAFADEMTARIAGTPVRLVEDSGPIHAITPDARSASVITRLDVGENGVLRIVSRNWFSTTGDYARPYLTTDDAAGSGRLNLAIRHRSLFSRPKCEFLRQLTFEIDRTDWQSLTTLSICNRDGGNCFVRDLPLGDAKKLAEHQRISGNTIALESLNGFARGC
jgi:hypothetical protein